MTHMKCGSARKYQRKSHHKLPIVSSKRSRHP